MMTENDFEKKNNDRGVAKNAKLAVLSTRKIESIISKFKDVHDEAISLKLIDDNISIFETDLASENDENQKIQHIEYVYLKIVKLLINHKADLTLRKIVLNQEMEGLSAPKGKNSARKLKPVSTLLAASQRYETAFLEKYLDFLNLDVSSNLNTIINYQFDGVNSKYDNENNILEVSYAPDQMELLSDVTRQSLLRRLAELEILMRRLMENWVENIKQRSLGDVDLNQDFDNAVRQQSLNVKFLITDELIKTVDDLFCFDNIDNFKYQCQPNAWMYIREKKFILSCVTLLTNMRYGLMGIFMQFMVLNFVDINVKEYIKSLITSTFFQIAILVGLVLVFLYRDYRADKKLAVDSLSKANEQICTVLKGRLSQFRGAVVARFKLISERKASEFENLVERVKQQRTTDGGPRSNAMRAQKAELLSSLESRLSELSRFERKIANLGKELKHDG